MRQIRHFRSRETNTRLETPRCGDGSAFGRAPAAADLKRQRSTEAASDPFSRRMLHFSIAYSLYLALPLSWGFNPIEIELDNPTYGYSASGYYGIVTALMGFLSALTCRDRAIFPNSIFAKLFVLAFLLIPHALYCILLYQLHIELLLSLTAI